MTRRGTALVLVLALSLIPNTLNQASSAGRRSETCFGKRATIAGTNDADVLVGTDHADVIVAEGGNDTVSGKGGRDLICSGPGRDTVQGGKDGDHVAGGSGHDSLRGGGDSDDLHGNSGSDRLSGGAEADFLRPANGDDIVRGGEGLDVVEYFDAGHGIRANMMRHHITGWGFDDVRSVSQIEATNFDDVIVGGRSSEAIDGLRGDDRLVGGGGLDYLSGDAGSDYIDGGRGADYAIFYLSRNPVTANLKRGTATGEGGDTLKRIESLFGSPNADTLVGNARENHFIGGNGGLDRISGNGGRDLFYAFADAAIDGGAGRDEVYFLIGPLIADLTTGVASADSASFTLAGVEVIHGTSDDDEITGDENANLLVGGGGNDVLMALGGDDVIRGDNGDDQLDGGLDSDVVVGGPGDDRCINGERTRQCEQAPLNMFSSEVQARLGRENRLFKPRQRLQLVVLTLCPLAVPGFK